MEKTIKYLENGEYHYATVKDVGDLAKLKTDSKDDLVAAINDLFENGGENAGKPEGYDKLVNNVADAIQKQQQMSSTITNMQQTAQLSDAEMAHMKQVQEELRQEYLKAIKELNEAVEKAKADAAALDKKTSDMQDKIDETFADVNKEVSDVHKQLDAEAKGLHKDLDETKTNLEATRKDLLNSTQEYGQVHSEVKELQDKFSRRVWSTDLDPVREQVSKNSTEVQQTKDELGRKADQSNLDLVTNSVENLSAKVKQNASGLEVAVKRDELGGDVARLLGDKTNLLLGTRSFSGEDNWKNRDTVTIEPGYYKGLKSAAVQVLDGSIYQPYRVKADTSYTFSFFAREDKDNPKAKLAIKPIDAKNINIDNEEQVVHITTEWQRFAVTFSVDKECDISIQVIQGPETTNNVLHLAGLKLQYGQNDTPWEPNEADVAENIEHTESQFNVYSDQITGIVKKQEKMGDTERQLDTRIKETAEGLKQTSKDLQNANGKITEFKGQLESTAKGLKTEYEKYTNEAIGQISDSSLNLIHNSAFSNQDNQFESWQNISAKATVREDSNNLHWVELTQSGQGTDNPIGVTSNYFIVKQGKVTVAVDVKLGDKANLDNQNILLLELYDESKKRVDFTDVSVSQLGLSMSVLNDHNVHRGLYRLGIDRKDVKYMTVKAILHRNGDLWLTNFSARLSSIDDGGYTPNPDDVNHQILKMNTKIEEDAEHIALKANSVDVTRDIKSAVDGVQVGGTNLLLETSIDEKSGKSYDFAQYSIAGGLQPGTTYTMSGWARVDQKAMDNKQNVFVCAYTSDWSWSGWLNIAGSLTAKYNKITFTTPTGKSFSPVVTIYLSHPNGDNSKDPISGLGYISKLKLEEGNKATSWSPAPEDTSAEIKAVKDAAIQVASDQINLHVNELSTQFDDKLNKRINEQKTAYEKITSDRIEQTVKKITDVQDNVNNLKEKVDSNNGGGINLQKGTKDCSFQIGTNGNPSSIETYNSDTKMIHTQNGGFYTSYSDSSFVPTPGEFYTISADVKGDGAINGSGFRYEGGNNGTMGNVTLSDTWQRIINTVHVDRVQGQWVIYPSSSKNLYVKHIKIERGTIATPWTPAPEDINQTIKDATEYKTVTGTIDFNNLKTQQKIFYKDTQATNTPAGGNYWYYLDVEPGYDGRILQTAISDRDNITWVRTFAVNWSPWVKQADQRNIDDLNNQISSFKTETTASVKNLGDRVTTEVNSITTQMNNKFKEVNTKLDVANGKIEGKVTETQVNDILNGKGYATQSWAESNFRMKSDSIELEVRKITDPIINKINSNNGGGVNLLKGTADFSGDWIHRDTEWNRSTEKYNGLTVYKVKQEEDWAGLSQYYPVKAGETYTFSAYARYSSGTGVSRIYIGLNTDPENGHNAAYAKVGVKEYHFDNNWQRVEFTFTISNSGYIKPRLERTNNNQNVLEVCGFKLEKGSVATPWSPNPQDIYQKIDTQTLDSANIDNMRTQGHYFVRNLTGTPIPGWVYVDVTGNNNDRIRQDVYADNSTKHMYRRLFGSSWSDWEQGAYVSDVNNLKTETTAKITNLGDRVTTEVNSVETRVNNKIDGIQVGGRNLAVGTDKDIVIDDTGNTGTQGWCFVIIHLAEQPKLGDQITISAEGVLTGNGNLDDYTVILYNETTTDARSVQGRLKPGQRSSVTVKVDNLNGTGDTVLLIYAGNPSDTQGKKNVVHHLKIEKGNKPTEWSLAPEDTLEAIKEVNTKWDVANGQIQGKVTETQVNDILNGKGYATQSWAQTMFTMKSDAITLQAVRDNITNGIQNQVNDTRNQVKGLQNQFNTQTGINLLKGTADFSGSWFNKDANGWSIMSGWQAPTSENKSERNNNVVYQDSGHAWDGLGQTVELDTGEYTFSMWMWPTLSGNESMNIYAGDSQYGGTAKVNFSGYRYSASQPQNRWILVKTYLTVTQGGKLSIRPELNQASGTIYVASYMLQHGHVENPVWAPAPDDLAPKSIISSINITPDQIKIASNKIEIDGNTYIHGDLQAQDVRLVGKRGAMDLSGDKGLLLSNNDGSEVAINENGLGLKYKNDFSMDIDSSLLTLSKRSAALDQPEPIAFGNIGSVMKGHDPKVNGFMLRYNPGSLNDSKKRGATFMSFGYNTPDIGKVVSQIELYGQDTEINVQDSGKTTKRTQRKGIHIQDALEFDTNTSVRFPQAHDHLFLHSEKWDISQQAGYYQPSIRLVSDGGSLGNAGVTFQWDAIKPFGAVDMTDARLWVYGVDHGIKNVWVSWSNWDGGERYPALVNDIGYWGGIAFPKSGRVTLFDADGRYYTPDRNTGIGAYNNYIGKNNNWH